MESRWRRSISLGFVILGGILVAALIASMAASLRTGAACAGGSGDALPVWDDTTFVSAEAQRGSPSYPDILSTGTVVPRDALRSSGVTHSLEEAYAGRGLVAVLADELDADLDGVPNPAMRAYYGYESLDSADTIVDFLQGGGIYIEQRSISGSADPAVIKEALVGRAADVQIGPYAAVIVHADPLPGGTPTFNIYWEEDEQEIVLISAASLEETLVIARGLYC